MISNLDQLRDENDFNLVADLFKKCLGKTKEEIKQIFLDAGIEIDDECAKEGYEFCKRITPVDDATLKNASGGEIETIGVGSNDTPDMNLGGATNGVLPPRAKNMLDMAIESLEKMANNTEMELCILLIRGVIDDLKELMARPYNRDPFKDELTRIEIRTALLPTNNRNLMHKDNAVHFIGQAQRITYEES